MLYTWRYAQKPANKAEALSLLEAFDLKATRKVSPYEIEIHLKQPIGDMPGLLSNRPMYIVADGLTNFSSRRHRPFKFVELDAGRAEPDECEQELLGRDRMSTGPDAFHPG